MQKTIIVEDNKELYSFKKKMLDIYDINDLILRLTDYKYQSFIWTEMALIQYGNGKGCIVDYEAIGKEFNSLDEKLKVDVSEKEEEVEQEDGSIVKSVSLHPYGTIKLSARDIMEKAEHHQEQAGDFFSKCYGSNWRCQDNLQEIIDELKNAGYFDSETILEAYNQEDIINEIVTYFGMPEDDEDGTYAYWNKNALTHDLNNGRGDEWVETFEDHKLPKPLMKKYLRMIGYFDDKAGHIVNDPDEYIDEKDVVRLEELFHMDDYPVGLVEDTVAQYLEDICFREGNIAYPTMDYYKEALEKTIDNLERLFASRLKDKYLESTDFESNGIKIAKIIQDAMKDECGPFGGQRPRRNGRVLEMHSQSPSTFYTFHDDGSVDVAGQDYDSQGDGLEEFTFHYNDINEFLNSGDDGWFLYFKEEHPDAVARIKDILDPDTVIENLKEEYDRISKEAEAWLDKEITDHNFKIVSKREYSDFHNDKIDSIHYQIISNEGNKTKEDLEKEADWIDNVLEILEGRTGSPCTYNMGLQVDGFISCGFDCRATSDKYKDKVVESYGLDNIFTILIPTGLYGKDNLEIFNSLAGQLSDGMWENSSRMGKYYQYMDYKLSDDNEVMIRVPRDYRWYLGFESPSDIKRWIANHLKAIVKEYIKYNDGEWSRDCTHRFDGWFHKPEPEIREVYRVYDKLLDRKDRVGSTDSYLEDYEPSEDEHMVDLAISWLFEHELLYSSFCDHFDYYYDEKTGDEINKPDFDAIDEWIGEHDEQVVEDYNNYMKDHAPEFYDQDTIIEGLGSEIHADLDGGYFYWLDKADRNGLVTYTVSNEDDPRVDPDSVTYEEFDTWEEAKKFALENGFDRIIVSEFGWEGPNGYDNGDYMEFEEEWLSPSHELINKQKYLDKINDTFLESKASYKKCFYKIWLPKKNTWLKDSLGSEAAFETRQEVEDYINNNYNNIDLMDGYEIIKIGDDDKDVYLESYLAEGCWGMPYTLERVNRLKQLMSSPLPKKYVGDGGSMNDALGIGDDQLYDNLGELDPEDDARKVIQDFIKDYVLPGWDGYSYSTKQGSSNGEHWEDGVKEVFEEIANMDLNKQDDFVEGIEDSDTSVESAKLNDMTNLEKKIREVPWINGNRLKPATPKPEFIDKRDDKFIESADVTSDDLVVELDDRFILCICDGNGAASRGLGRDKFYVLETEAVSLRDAINKCEKEIREIDNYDLYNDCDDECEDYYEYFNNLDPSGGDPFLAGYIHDGERHLEVYMDDVTKDDFDDPDKAYLFIDNLSNEEQDPDANLHKEIELAMNNGNIEKAMDLFKELSKKRQEKK